MKYLLLSLLFLAGITKKDLVSCDQRIYMGNYKTIGSEQEQIWKLELIQNKELKLTCLTHQEIISFNCDNCNTSNDTLILCSRDHDHVKIRFVTLASNDCVGEDKFTKLEYIEEGNEMFTCLVDCEN